MNCLGAWPRPLASAAAGEAFRVLRAGGRIVAVADCTLAAGMARQLGRPHLLDWLTVLEAAGFDRPEHERRLEAEGEMHLVTAVAKGVGD